MELVRAFERLNRADLALAGGKGANLGAMVQAGLPVPPGFVVVTDAYRLFVERAGIQAEIERIARAVDADHQEALDAASVRIRAMFGQHDVPAEVAAAITDAYAALGGGPVAVRSSATAEDLPDASFAGQQETYLNIEGAEQVVQAVKRCWSSLWTGRALSYRVRNGIAPGDVALAAVVQQLVPADVAGVLFTADPVSGHRGRMVIDGAWGLGESVVSGIVSPDNWMADGSTGAIIAEQIAAKSVMTVRVAGGTEERKVADDLQRRPVLDAGQVAALVELGRRTSAYFGAPQDMEWALAGGRFYLLQSRPITTLFPLPEPAPPAGAGLRIYATLAGMQGVLEPITPAGLAVFRTLARRSGPRFIGVKAPGPDAPQFFTVAAGRFYFDVTNLIRTKGGRFALGGDKLDATMGLALRDLLDKYEGQLPPMPVTRGIPVRKGLILTLAGRVLRAVVNPHGARRHAQRKIEGNIRSLTEESRRLRTMADRVAFIEKAVDAAIGGVAAQSAPLALVGVAARFVAESKLQAWGIDPGLLEPVGRAIPHNPTTEMDLALWRTSRQLLAEGVAPRADHPAVQAFLSQYGHRAVREIDTGVPRWSDEPEHVLHLLATYMGQGPGATDPEHHFARGKAAAEEAAVAITAQVRRETGAMAAAFMRLLLSRFRQLAGLREWHKFYVVQVLAIIRQVLSAAGAELVEAGRLDRVDDVFFLDFEHLTAGGDLRAVVAGRRADYARELKRRLVPPAMTSEGEVAWGVSASQDGVLAGAGASAGVHEGVVRVILNPVGARLEPGEILVAPGTDPAWTPLFLTAGALVTETGGMMSHGSVVAREYGIPAVVGVPEATTRLRTGQRVRVDGGAGVIVLLDS